VADARGKRANLPLRQLIRPTSRPGQQMKKK
jgi:hypothetical protein